MSVWRIKPGVSIVETMGSPHYHFTAAESSITRVFMGRFRDLLKSRPKVGSAMSGLDSKYHVADVDIVPAGGGKGTMTIRLDAGPADKDETQVSDPVYEIEWQEIEKPIEKHPRYKDVPEHYMAMVQAYFATSDPAERAGIEAAINSVRARELITKRLRGTESYVIYIPVARKTTDRTTHLLTNACGAVGDPGFSVPTGYSWMKSASRCSRTGRLGKWKHSEEWTGLKDLDADLYPVLDSYPE